jgi:hypothetical protein
MMFFDEILSDNLFLADVINDTFWIILIPWHMLSDIMMFSEKLFSLIK